MMRPQIIAIALVLMLAPCLARELRAAQQSCPTDMVDIFKTLRNQKWFQEEVAKECAKLDKPNCYADCTCFMFDSRITLIRVAAKNTNNKMSFADLMGACSADAAKHGTGPLMPDWVVEYKNDNDCWNYLEKSGENEKCLKKVAG